MTGRRPTRFQRRDAAQRATARRLLAYGAAVGLVAGLVAQRMLADDLDAETAGLVRMAMLVPAALYVLWWILAPGLGLDRDPEQPVPVTDRPLIDAEERVRAIEATFDDAAVPAAGRRERTSDDAAERDRFRSSLGARGTMPVGPEAFGIRRPAGRPGRGDSTRRTRDVSGG